MLGRALTLPSPSGRGVSPTSFSWLGRTRYAEALEVQRRQHAARCRGECGDAVLLTEHERVLTAGRNADDRHLRVPRGSLAAHNVELLPTERGGDLTYHGPGQLVAYPICDLRDYDGGVRGHVRRLEETAVRLLRRYGIEADRRPGTPGVWVESAKIASVGVYVSRWVTMHGVAINIAPCLDDFDLIHPCGLIGVRMTSVSELLGRAPAITDAAQAYAEVFQEVFSAGLRCLT